VTRIEVMIDRIVLSGIDPASRDAFVAGVRAGLERTLSAAEPSAYAARSSPVVRIGGLTVEPGRAGARRLGSGVGRAIGRAAR
jgi:hypothetical protein